MGIVEKNRPASPSHAVNRTPLCGLSTRRLVSRRVPRPRRAPPTPKDLSMTIKVGDRLPNVTVRLVTPDGPKPVETKDYFAGKKVVLFGLPGASPPPLPQEPPARLHCQRGGVQSQGRRCDRHDRGQRPFRAPGLVGRDGLQ